MRTACSSDRPGGAPPGTPPPWEQTPTPGADPPGADTGADSPPPPLTESQMPVKILPCPNFVVGGKNTGKMAINTRKVREFCQSGKLGTL